VLQATVLKERPVQKEMPHVTVTMEFAGYKQRRNGNRLYDTEA